MATADPPVVTSVWIDASPQDVFGFFTDPGRLTQWLGHAAELDPVPGGRFAVDINHRQVRGNYLELRSPHRVVFTWGDAGSAELPPGSSRVEVDLTAAEGGTTVTLRHHDLGSAQHAEHSRGWPVVLARLVATA